MKIREIQGDDSFGQQQAAKDGYVLARSYLRPEASVRTLVFEKKIEIPGTCEDTECAGPIDIRTLCCTRCGVSHSGPCPNCGRFGFHRDDCPDMQPAAPEEPEKHRVVCSWCDLVLEPGSPGAKMTNTCCRSCWEKHFPEIAFPDDMKEDSRG